MKKIYITLTLILAATLSLTAQYSTPGTGVEWTFEDLVSQSGGAVTEEAGTFFVNEALTISTNDVLSINSGIEVKIAGGVLITVNGSWNATPGEQALFTAIDTEDRFEGFRFEETPSSILSNCIIEYGGGLKLVESDMQITDCIIRNFDKENSTGAIDLFHSSPDITGNEIYKNAGPAVASGATSTSSPQIFNNNIYENNTSNANTPQINLGTSASDSIRIVGNTITGMYEMAGGIAVTTLAGGSLECVIKDNVITDNRYGITCYGNNISSVITNNQIFDNNIEDNPDTGGSGINFFGGESNTSLVSHNQISGNLWGITIQNNARPNMGQLEGDIYNEGMNEIYGNGNNGQDYDLYNNTPNSIMAQNNYWGTDDTDVIEDHIFHEPDDSSLGFVDYLPVLTGGVNIDTPETAGNELIGAVYPVPARDKITIGLNTAARVKIYNAAGEMLVNRHHPAGPATIKTTGWPAGLYTLKVTKDQKSIAKTFLIAR